MNKSLQEIMQTLPAAQQAAVDARFQELVAEELSLRDLRKARTLTQEQMAKLLHMRQESVSRLEQRSDSAALDFAQLHQGHGWRTQVDRPVSRPSASSIGGFLGERR